MTRTRGFTLTDLLVTVVIIVLLIAVALPVIGRVRKGAEANRSKADLNSISVALESLKLENGDYPRIDRKTAEAMPGVVNSGARGSIVMTKALLKKQGLMANFRIVKVQEDAGKVTLLPDGAEEFDYELLADRHGQPILYFPALPVRLPVNARNAYVANYGYVELPDGRGMAIQDIDTGERMPFPAMFNVADNAAVFRKDIENPTRLMQEALGAHTTGQLVGASTHSTPKHSGSYLLWSAGADKEFGTADDIRHVGGSQPTMLTPGGSIVQAIQALPFPEYVLPPEIPDPDRMPPQDYLTPPAYTKPPVSGFIGQLPTPRPSTPPDGSIIITDPPYNATPDGGADDADAIQRAINDAAAQGKAVVIPEGKFDVGRGVKLQTGTSLYGPGTINWSGGGGGFALEIHGANDIFMDGITFDGRGLWPSTQVNGLVIQNCTFKNIRRGSDVDGRAITASAGLVNSIIQNNLFENVDQEGIWINTLAHNTVIDGNGFDGVWQPMHIITGPMGHGLSGNGGSDLVVTNNVMIRMLRMGIEFQGSNHTNAVFANNSVSDWQDFHADAKGDRHSFAFSLMNDGLGMKVLDNTLIASFHSSSPRAGESTTSAKTLPVGCETGGRDTIVQGNFISGFNQGMHVNYADRSVIQSNTFVGQGWASIWFPGYSSAYKVQVLSNNFDVSCQAAVLFTGSRSNGTVINGNTATLGGSAQLVAWNGGNALTGVVVGSNDVSRK